MRDDFERNRGVTDLVGLVSFCLVGRGFESSYWENRRVGVSVKWQWKLTHAWGRRAKSST